MALSTEFSIDHLKDENITTLSENNVDIAIIKSKNRKLNLKCSNENYDKYSSPHVNHENIKSNSISDVTIDIEENKISNINQIANKEHEYKVENSEQESSNISDNNCTTTIKELRLRAGLEENITASSGRGNFNFNYTGEFNSKEIRQKFIKKVYSILTLMLAIVFGEILFFIFSPEAKDFLKKYILLCVILSLYMYIVSMYAISCYENVRRTVPLNFIVLTIMSMSLGVAISCACIHYQLRIIILAICYTFALSLSVSILAAYCPIDITKFGVLIFVMGAIILIMAVITSFLLSHVYFEYKKAEIILGAVGVFVFSIYLAYDTQLIMGGRKEEISPAEYVLAVVILFTDIINIFMCMLNLINGEEG